MESITKTVAGELVIRSIPFLMVKKKWDCPHIEDSPNPPSAAGAIQLSA